MTVSVWSPSVVYGPAPVAPATTTPSTRTRGHHHKTRVSAPSLQNIAGQEAVNVILSADAMKKKRRRSTSLIKQFEERQRVHERNEQKRREEALNSRRRRQQEATNAYKAALNKELSKRNKPSSSRIGSASSVSSVASMRRQHLYRTPTVDEVLSSIRGHSLGGSLRTYGESSNKADTSLSSTSSLKPSFTIPTRDSARATDNVTRVSDVLSEQQIRSNDTADMVPTAIFQKKTWNHTAATEGTSNYMSYMNYRLDNNDKQQQQQQQHRLNETTDSYSISSSNGPQSEGVSRRPRDMHVISDNNYKPTNQDAEDNMIRDSLEEDTLQSYISDYKGSYENNNDKASDPDRIKVQIDLTRFEQLDVSDCESIDEKSGSSKDTTPDKFDDSETFRVPSVQLLQTDQLKNRTESYFGPPPSSPQTEDSDSTALYQTSLSALSKHDTAYERSSKSLSSHSSSDQKSYDGLKPNYTIHTSKGESHIYASSAVEAVKVASQAAKKTAWNDSKVKSSPQTPRNNLKSVIKRTPSAGKKKSVRWDSVSALDDVTMEVDQFDISSEGQAILTKQYSHSPVRPYSATSYNREYTSDVETSNFNLQRTPTDAEINALWNKVRTTLHRNQAWEPPNRIPYRINNSSIPYNNNNNSNKKYNDRNLQESLKIYSNLLVEKDRYKSTGKRLPVPSHQGPSLAKMSEVTDNGHTMLSLEEQRIMQSLDRLNAKLKDTDGLEPKTHTISFTHQAPSERTPYRNETYRRLLNRKTNGLPPKYR